MVIDGALDGIDHGEGIKVFAQGIVESVALCKGIGEGFELTGEGAVPVHHQRGRVGTAGGQDGFKAGIHVIPGRSSVAVCGGP